MAGFEGLGLRWEIVTAADQFALLKGLFWGQGQGVVWVESTTDGFGSGADEGHHETQEDGIEVHFDCV